MSQLKVDDIVNSAGTGPVGFSKGINPTYGTEVRSVGTNQVLVSADAHLQLITPSAAISVTMPGDSKQGECFAIRNAAAVTTTNFITVKADNASDICRVFGDSTVYLYALQDNPSTSAHWTFVDSGSAGIYTPTASNIVNLDSTPTGSAICQFHRFNTFVTVRQKWAVDPTSAIVTTSFRTTVPIANTNFTGASVAIGEGVSDGAGSSVASGGWYMEPVNATQQIQIQTRRPETTNATNLFLSFVYQIQ